MSILLSEVWKWLSASVVRWCSGAQGLVSLGSRRTAPHCMSESALVSVTHRRSGHGGTRRRASLPTQSAPWQSKTDIREWVANIERGSERERGRNRKRKRETERKREGWWRKEGGTARGGKREGGKEGVREKVRERERWEKSKGEGETGGGERWREVEKGKEG